MIKELNVKMTNIQKVIKNRDLREVSAAVIGMLIFGYFLYEIPFPITRFACVISILWFAFVILKLRKAKPKTTTNLMDLSIKSQLDSQDESIQKQIDLLESVAYWYALPPFIINVIFLIGLGNPQEYDWVNKIAERVLPMSINLKIVTIIGLALFNAFIIWINQRAAKRDLKPILEKIKIVKDQLESDENYST